MTDRPQPPCRRCGSLDLIGPFEMDGLVDGEYRPTGERWTVCRECGGSSHVPEPLALVAA